MKTLTEFFDVVTRPQPSRHRAKLLEQIPSWMHMAPFRRRKEASGLSNYGGDFKKGKDGVYRNIYGEVFKQNLESVEIEDALVISSRAGKDQNYVILDIDFPVEVIRSSTSGKNHIYIDHIITDEQMDNLLKAMVACGLVNEGIYDLQWSSGKELSLRLPWVKKGVDKPFSQLTELEQEAAANGTKINYIESSNGPNGYVVPPREYYVTPSVDDSGVDW